MDRKSNRASRNNTAINNALKKRKSNCKMEKTPRRRKLTLHESNELTRKKYIEQYKTLKTQPQIISPNKSEIIKLCSASPDKFNIIQRNRMILDSTNEESSIINESFEHEVENISPNKKRIIDEANFAN